MTSTSMVHTVPGPTDVLYMRTEWGLTDGAATDDAATGYYCTRYRYQVAYLVPVGLWPTVRLKYQMSSLNF